jgi:hypothetical protein
MGNRSRGDVELVTVFEAADSFALKLARTSLDEAGIPFLESGGEKDGLPGLQGFSGIGETPLWRCTVRVQVAAADAAAARELLLPLEYPAEGGEAGG